MARNCWYAMIVGILCLSSIIIAAPPVTSGLVLHVEADSYSALADGAEVGTWTDLSGQGNTGFDIGNPTVHHNILNGHSIVRLDGDDTFGFMSLLQQ